MNKLKPCPDCGHKVSTKAANCPSCGKHFPFEMPTPVGIALALGIVWLILAIALQPSDIERSFQQSADGAERAACESKKRLMDEEARQNAPTAPCGDL